MTCSDLILTPELCTEAEARKAALAVAHNAVSPEETREFLEMIGLAEPTVPLLPPVKVVTVDGFTHPVPNRAAGETLCKCPGQKHVLSTHNSETTYVDNRGQRQCRAGIERRRKAEQVEDEGFDPGDVVLGPGERWCTCPGPKKHVLTPHTSKTTSVDRHGHRRCKARKRAWRDAS